MTESVLVTLEQKVLPQDHPVLGGPQRSHRSHYDFSNGSRIVVGGLDNSERLFSTEYDTVSVFEATETTENDFESLGRALRNGRMGWHQQIADCNPSAASHWLNQRAGTDKMLRLLSRHEDNPELWDSEKREWTPHGAQYMARLDALTGVRYLRLRLGKWATAEGVIYDGWDPAIHVIDPFDIPTDWLRFRVVDFGFTNPFVCLWIALDSDARMYVYRELYMSQRTVRVHAAQILDVTDDERIVTTVADHDAEDRATLHECGIPTVAAHKAVTVGIQAMQSRLIKADDGKPRLFLFRGALIERDPVMDAAKKPACTEQEIEAYCWAKSANGKPNKEEPAKIDDHGCDCLRYGCMQADRNLLYELPKDLVKLPVSPTLAAQMSVAAAHARMSPAPRTISAHGQHQASSPAGPGSSLNNPSLVSPWHRR